MINYRGGEYMHLFIFWVIFIFLVSVAFGLFLILKPNQAIEFQKSFYLKINWRMEPVNMALELRNTRMLGFVLIGVAIIFVAHAFIYIK